MCITGRQKKRCTHDLRAAQMSLALPFPVHQIYHWPTILQWPSNSSLHARGSVANFELLNSSEHTLAQPKLEGLPKAVAALGYPRSF
jgi:hypothetical protein